MTDFSRLAVQAALKQEWTQAVDLNIQALDANPQDSDALNRLGFAYLQLGQIAKAKSTYELALKYNQYNAIAKKSLARIELINQKKTKFDPTTLASSKTSFIEEPGKTKSVSLVRTADTQIIASVNAGIEVEIVAKNRRISIQTLSGTYLGSLPDDLAFRVGNLLKQGYQYKAHVKSTNSNTIVIFIRETSKPQKGNTPPSFPVLGGIKNTNIPRGDIYDAPIDVTPTGEEEDYE